MNDHARWNDTAAAYVLGAMAVAEREEFEAHLSSCEICRQEVDELRPAAEALPMASPLMVPPPELKDRIMAEVEREAELLGAAGAGADRPARTERRRRGSWLGGWRLAPVAATVLAAGVLAGFVIAGLGDGTQTYQATVDSTQLQGAQAELRVDDGDATLVADGLPEPRGDDVYQVWIKRPGVDAPEPSVLFLPRDGSAAAAVPDGADDAEAILVTREPRTGSETPSENPVMTISLS
jgi:anti-sigma-K factor RskA